MDSNKRQSGKTIRVSQDQDEQARRHACDRCRAYKVRCERQSPTAGGTHTCKRCMKARVECCTSPSLRMGRPRISTGTSTPNGDTLTLDSHDSLPQTMSFYSNTPATGDEAQSVLDFDFELLGNNIIGGDGGQSLQTLMASDGSEFTADIDSPTPDPFAEQHLNQSDSADRFDVAAAIPLRVKFCACCHPSTRISSSRCIP